MSKEIDRQAFLLYQSLVFVDAMVHSQYVFSSFFFLLALFDLSLPKKKIKDERKKKKMRTIKVESEDPCETLAPSDTPSAPPANIINSLPDTPSTPLPNIKEE